MVHRCLFLRYGLNGGYEMATFLQDEERPLLCIATDQVENHIDLLSQNLLELLLSIIVARTPTLAMCFSTSYLLSKCGMPVCRLAEPTEVKTRCTPAALAASAAAIPCRVSASVPPNGTVIAKREAAPSSAFLIAAVSSSDAATSVAPAFASNFAWLEFGSRVTARTLWPRSRRPRATEPPCLPVDPVTTTVSFCAMFCFLSPAVTPAAPGATGTTRKKPVARR